MEMRQDYIIEKSDSMASDKQKYDSYNLINHRLRRQQGQDEPDAICHLGQNGKLYQKQILQKQDLLSSIQKKLYDLTDRQEIEKILNILLKIQPRENRTKRLIERALSKLHIFKRVAIKDVFQKIKGLPPQLRKIYRLNDGLDQQEEPQELKQFQKILKDFEINDYSYLFKLQDKLLELIGKIIGSSNWRQVRSIYQPYFEHFLDLIKIKIDPIQESVFIYSTLFCIRHKIETAISYKGSHARINDIKCHPTDQLFKSYMQQLQMGSQMDGVYYATDPKDNQRVALSQLMAKCSQLFQGSNSWNDILDIVNSRQKERDFDQDPNKKQAMRLLMENIPSISIPSYDCLGCSRFFFFNHNLYRPQICKHIVVIVGSISQIAVNQSLIKDEMVALLNGKGGVLLFDCSQFYNYVFPWATYLTEKRKEEIQQIVGKYLEGIYPMPQINKEIFISWVPITQDPLEIEQIPKGSQYRLNYLEGLYICRIVVKPAHGHIVYFRRQEYRTVYSIRTKSLFPQGKRQLHGRGIYKFIKQKFKTYIQQIKDLDQIQKIVMGKNTSEFDHECTKPEEGIRVSQKDKKKNSDANNPETQYKYAAVVFKSQKDIENIKQKLKKYNIECTIKTPFEILKLNEVAKIIYHNIRFKELLYIIRNKKQFELGGKKLSIKRIGKYLHFTKSNSSLILPEDHFISFAVQLNKLYIKEQMKMWKFKIQQDEQFYIETDSRQSTVYMCLLMLHSNESIEFEDPNQVQKLNLQEKARRFSLHYHHYSMVIRQITQNQ